MTDYTKELASYIKREKRVLDALDLENVSHVMNFLVDKAREGARFFVCGNGGSSATASHFVCDFSKGIQEATSIPFKMMCLSDNTPMATAISNDIDYDHIFSCQLKLLAESGDVLILISGSGNSRNVCLASEEAKALGVFTVALTGYDGGKLGQMVDYHLHVPVDDMQIAEDIHMVLDHMMMSVLCKEHGSVEKRDFRIL